MHKPNFTAQLTNKEAVRKVAASIGCIQHRGKDKGQGSIREMLEEIGGGDILVMHHVYWERIKQGVQGRGTVGKAIVFGLLERNAGDKASRVKTRVVRNTKKRTLQPEIRNGVQAGSSLFTKGIAHLRRAQYQVYVSWYR